MMVMIFLTYLQVCCSAGVDNNKISDGEYDVFGSSNDLIHSGSTADVTENVKMLYCSNRSFPQKLPVLAAIYLNLKVFYTVDNPTKNWKGGSGYISNDMVVKGLPAPSNDTPCSGSTTTWRPSFEISLWVFSLIDQDKKNFVLQTCLLLAAPSPYPCKACYRETFSM